MPRGTALAAIGLITLGALLAAAPSTAREAPIVIGSKTFTESYLLAEIMAQALENAGYPVERRFGFGGTLITYEALRRGEIDVYPEYTGTIAQVILEQAGSTERGALDRALAAHGLTTLPFFGFNNTYALVLRESLARERGLARISDLRGQSDLAFGFSHEFRRRPDGWPGLRESYSLDVGSSGIEHGLAYRALADGKIDVTDAYSTDGDLLRYPLTILEDDLRYFPEYRGLPLVRIDLPDGARDVLAALGERIDSSLMRALNARVVVDGESIPAVAAGFLGAGGRNDAFWRRLGRNTLTHLELTLAALAAATVVALGAAVAVYERRRLVDTLLYVSGLLQTIPSIALLALLIPVAGVGAKPAIIALFLYSLLPILRNAVTALRTVDPLLKRVAEAMGMRRRERLRHVLLPLALPHVLAGIKTAAIISIGTATLAAFIGAGGLGEPIVTGLALNDTGLILQGAIPAAVLALLTELGFELLERRLVPAHMLSSRLPD